MEKPWPRECFVCAKPIGSAFSPDDTSPPSGATVWTSSGNYGSTVYDDFAGNHLEVMICDDCLVAQKTRVHERRKIERSQREPTHEWRGWGGDLDPWRRTASESNQHAVKEIEKHETDGWGATDRMLPDGTHLHNMGANIVIEGKRYHVKGEGESWDEAIAKFRRAVEDLDGDHTQGTGVEL